MSVRGAAARAAVQAAIEATADESGTVTPDRVVEAAADEASPLHGEFLWDNSAAGHLYRLAQARHLIREIRFEVADVPKRVIGLISYVHRPGSAAQSYVPLSKVVRNKKLARQVVEAELVRCEAAITRAREIAGVLNLRAELDALLREAISIKKRAIAA